MKTKSFKEIETDIYINLSLILAASISSSLCLILIIHKLMEQDWIQRFTNKHYQLRKKTSTLSKLVNILKYKIEVRKYPSLKNRSEFKKPIKKDVRNFNKIISDLAEKRSKSRIITKEIVETNEATENSELNNNKLVNDGYPIIDYKTHNQEPLEKMNLHADSNRNESNLRIFSPIEINEAWIMMQFRFILLIMTGLTLYLLLYYRSDPIFHYFNGDPDLLVFLILDPQSAGIWTLLFIVVFSFITFTMENRNNEYIIINAIVRGIFLFQFATFIYFLFDFTFYQYFGLHPLKYMLIFLINFQIFYIIAKMFKITTKNRNIENLLNNKLDYNPNLGKIFKIEIIYFVPILILTMLNYPPNGWNLIAWIGFTFLILWINLKLIKNNTNLTNITILNTSILLLRDILLSSFLFYQFKV